MSLRQESRTFIRYRTEIRAYAHACIQYIRRSKRSL